MNVLVIDDDYICNLISRKTLEAMGFVHEIHIAENGEQAINLLNERFLTSRSMPDVILLDLNMPVMDGFGFLDAFRKLSIPNRNSIKIIIVSSSADPRDINRAKGMGVNEYLTKPISENLLMKVLQGRSLAA